MVTTTEFTQAIRDKWASQKAAAAAEWIATTHPGRARNEARKRYVVLCQIVDDLDSVLAEIRNPVERAHHVPD